MAEGKSAADQPQDVDAQAREQTGTQQVRLRIDEREMTTNYSNAFRTNATAEEVFVDFGCNMANPVPQQQQPEAGGEAPAAEIVFKANDRVILNYYTAKRLAITLAGNGVSSGRFSRSEGSMPRDRRNMARSPTTLLLGVTFTMSPRRKFTSR